MGKVAIAEHDCIQTDNIETLFDRSIPSWVRAVMITLLGVLFVLLGGNWLYGVSTYATKESVAEVKAELKDTRQQLTRASDRQTELMQQILAELRNRP